MRCIDKLERSRLCGRVVGVSLGAGNVAGDIWKGPAGRRANQVAARGRPPDDPGEECKQSKSGKDAAHPLHENVLSAVRVEVYLGAIPGLRIGSLSIVPRTATRGRAEARGKRGLFRALEAGSLVQGAPIRGVISWMWPEARGTRSLRRKSFSHLKLNDPSLLIDRLGSSGWCCR